MRYRLLAPELDRWVADGLVTAEQADAIRRTYDAGEERRTRSVAALATVGAVVAGLGVILFFAANWDGIPRPARVALLIGLILGSYAGADRLRRSRPRVAEALFLLGGFAFGTSLFLVGQMYHVQAHDPLAFLVWSAGAGATAAAVRSRPLTALSILALAAYLVYELTEDDVALSAVAVALYGAALFVAGTLWRDPVFSGPMRGLGYALATGGLLLLSFADIADDLGDSVAYPIAFNALLAAIALAAILSDEPWLANAGFGAAGALVLVRFVDFAWEALPRSLAFVGAGILLLGLAFALERRRRAAT